MPAYFVISNLLVVPFAGLLLVTALCVLLLSFWTWAADAAAWLLDAELGIVDGIVARVAALPHSVIEVQHFTFPMLILAYTALILAYQWLRNYNINKLATNTY